MKKLLFVLISALMITSCNNVIDKKVSLETAKEDIKEIREKYKDEYTESDFDALSEQLAGNVFGTFLAKGEDAAKGVKFEKTYKEYLDEAKKERLEKEKIIAELNAAANVTIDKFSRIHGTGFASDYDIKMPVAITVNNNTNKTISGITGKIEVIDMFDKKIENLGFEYTDPINPKSKLTKDFTYDIGFGNDLKDLNQSSFDKLKFKWIPEKIIFTDGSYLPKE